MFILPKYRNCGVAQQVVEELLAEQGEWHVAIYEKDIQALSFWEGLFRRLNIKQCKKLDPPETDGFHEFIVENI